MFTTQCSSACAFIGILLATIAIVACDYGGNQASSLIDKSLDDGNGLCSGGRCVRQTRNEASGAMWFGPRLGRRRRSDDRIGSSDEDMSILADAINGELRNFMSYRDVEDKRHTTKFTPRLGRELADDFFRKSMDYNFEDQQLSRLFDNQGDSDWQRQLPPPPPPPPFAPRLGRHLIFNPSPRLGRQLSFLQKA